MIVVFDGHADVGNSLTSLGYYKASGLCLFDTCLAAQSGFMQKAKVTFLAACGIDTDFLSYWQQVGKGKGQALIYPVYGPNPTYYPNGGGPTNPQHSVNLIAAAQDLQFLLDQLAAWNNVRQAVELLNGTLTTANYYWAIEGDPSVTFAAGKQ